MVIERTMLPSIMQLMMKRMLRHQELGAGKMYSSAGAQILVRERGNHCTASKSNLETFVEKCSVGSFPLL